jgi:hypothetical protein
VIESIASLRSSSSRLGISWFGPKLTIVPLNSLSLYASRNALGPTRRLLMLLPHFEFADSSDSYSTGPSMRRRSPSKFFSLQTST